MKNTQNLKAYFYNGFSKPELLATSIAELLTDTKIEDTFLGDVTEQLREEVEANKNSLQDLKEALQYFDIYVNPTYKELRETSRQWFGDDIPEHHFSEFKKEEEENKKENIKLALSNVTRYKDMEDYKQDYETLEEVTEDFNEKLENGYIQDITPGTYNGATQETTLYELTDNNIMNAIYTDLYETDSLEFLQELEEDTKATRWEYIRLYTEIHNIFIIGERIFIDRY